jgi:hypothetical protein
MTIELSPLQVRTYTGDIRPYIRLARGQPAGGCIEWEQLPPDYLVAATQIVAGQEPVSVFHPRIPASLKLLHLRLVTIASACRAQFMEVIYPCQRKS